MFLPRDTRGRIKFKFAGMLDKLNTILLSQYLQKLNNSLGKDDIITVQRCDKHLNEIVQKLQKDETVNEKFLIKVWLIYG